MADKTLDQTPEITNLQDNEFVAVSQGNKMKHIQKLNLLKTVNGAINGVKNDVIALSSQKGTPGGIATLDLNGKVPLNQMGIPGVTFMGEWDADTNTPHLQNGTGSPGQFYDISTPGIHDFGDGPIAFPVYAKVMYGADGKWVKYYESQGVIQIPFSTELHFDGEYIMAPKTLTENTVFSVDMANAIAGGGGSMTIIGAGGFTIDFLTAGFETQSDPDLFAIGTGEKRKIYFRWDGTDKEVIVTAPTDAPAPTPPIPTEGLLTFTGGPSGGSGSVVPITNGFGVSPSGSYATALETVYNFPLGTDRVFYHKYTGTTDRDSYLVLMDSPVVPNGSLNNAAIKSYFYSDGSFSGNIAYKDGAGSLTYISPNYAMVAGRFYGYRIVGSVIDIVESTDEITWTTKQSLTITRTTDMYIGLFLFTDKTMHFAKFKNV